MRPYHPVRYLVIAVTTLVAPPAAAQVVAYDPFAQPLGQLNGFASSGSGATWPNGNPTWSAIPPFNGGVVETGSLSYGPLSTAGNKARMQGFVGSNNASYRSLVTNHGGAGNDLWLSFLINADAKNQGLGLYFSLSNPVAVFGTLNNGNYGMTLYNPATAAGTLTFDTTTAAVGGTTHLVAVHMDLRSAGAANAVTMWLDPDTSSLGTGTAPTGGQSVSYTTAQSFPFEQVVLQNLSQQLSSVYYDEIRYGTDWASVSAVPVPEPAGLLTAAVATLGGVQWYRRRTG